MSRTRRRRLPGYSPGEKHYEKAKAEHTPGVHPGNWWCHLQEAYDFRKAHWLHGRDAYRDKMPVGYPTNRCPKGYSDRDEVWGMKGKRTAKAIAARYRRIQGKAACEEDQ